MKNTTFEMSFNFSDTLTEKKLQAVAHVNGVLNELVQAAAPVTDGYVADLAKGDDEAFLGNMGFLLSDATVQENGAYAAASSTLVDQLQPLVVAHVAHARNVVKPLVLDFTKGYIEYLESNRIKEASSIFEIKKCQLPAILTDENFLGEVAWAKDINGKQPAEYLRLESPPEGSLSEFCMTGSGGVDKLIAEWLSSKPADWLQWVWHSVFGQAEYLPTNAASYYTCEQVVSPYDSAEFCLAVFLMARRLQMKIPEGVKMSLSKYDNLVTSIKDFAAVQMVNHVKRVASLNSNKTLVVYYDELNYTLYVNGDLYGTWLDEGNTPELLLGMVSSGALVKTVPEINERGEKFKRAWDSFSTLYKAKETNNLHNYARQMLMTSFHTHLQKVAPEEQEVRLKDPNFIDNCLAQAADYVNALSMKELEDAHVVGLYLVAKIRFSYTSAYYILSDIEAVGKENPDIDPREAALLATTNYIADYLADQIALKTI